jgi:hypothetical protein
MEGAAPQARPALGGAVPQARRAAIGSGAVPQASAVIIGPAARRTKRAAATGASGGPRPEAVLVFLVNPRRMARIVLVAESRTRIGRGVP